MASRRWCCPRAGSTCSAAATDAWPVSFKPELNRRLAALAGAGFVDPLPHWCAAGGCRYRDAHGLLIADEGHFTAEGSLDAVAAYFPLLRSTPAPRQP